MIEAEEQELKDRISLIEHMIAEGRQTTETWGWTFVLWGCAYYVAIAWATWGHSNIAWPVTMLGTSALTGVIAWRKGDKQPETKMGRAMAAIWIGVGISLFLFCLSLGIAGRGEQHVFLAAIEIMLGAANATSSILLKWKAQFLCALTWWTASVATAFVTVTQSSILFLAAIFFGQIVFGTYMMISEARERKTNPAKSGAAHA